jgi:hypothetical protein
MNQEMLAQYLVASFLWQSDYSEDEPVTPVDNRNSIPFQIDSNQKARNEGSMFIELSLEACMQIANLAMHYVPV